MTSKKTAHVGLVIALLARAATCVAQETPEMPSPVKEHEWLKQFVGEWDVKSEMTMEGAPPMKCEGTETARQIGGFWVVGEMDSVVVGQPMKALLTVGYDPEKKKYVGTWVDSMTHHLWKYEGTVDETGKILTLEAEGPNMMEPGKTAKFRDAFEFKSKDHKVLTSSMQGPDGKWIAFGTTNYTRKK